MIALVITIIVLIILAGVAINLSLGDSGIFNKAKYAKKEYINAKEQENEALQNYSNSLESLLVSSNRNGMLNFSIEAFDKKEGVYSPNKTTDIELNLVATKDINKGILLYTCGAGDNAAGANSSFNGLTITLNSESYSPKLVTKKDGYYNNAGYYSASAIYEMYLVENIKANDVIKITSQGQYAIVSMATLMSYTID